MGFPPISGGGGGAPTTSHYILDTADGALPNARVLTSGTRIQVDESAAGIARITSLGLVAAVVSMSAPQTIPDDASAHALLFDTVFFDPAGLYDVGNHWFDLPSGDTEYMLMAGIDWSYVGATHLAGTRFGSFSIVAGGGSLLGENRIVGSVTGTDGYFGNGFATLKYPSTGTSAKVRYLAQQSSGGSLDVFDGSWMAVIQLV